LIGNASGKIDKINNEFINGKANMGLVGNNGRNSVGLNVGADKQNGPTLDLNGDYKGKGYSINGKLGQNKQQGTQASLTIENEVLTTGLSWDNKNGLQDHYHFKSADFSFSGKFGPTQYSLRAKSNFEGTQYTGKTNTDLGPFDVKTRSLVGPKGNQQKVKTSLNIGELTNIENLNSLTIGGAYSKDLQGNETIGGTIGFEGDTFTAGCKYNENEEEYSVDCSFGIKTK
jgi:hypothetical protein